jgi:predicted transcriptional regulator of viral defense system
MDAAGRLDAEAARQHGVITRSEARSAGLTDRRIRLRVASGRWRRESRDVFVVAGAPQTPRQALLIASLRHDAAASHWSAAWLHGLVDAPPSRPHVSRSAMSGTRDRTAVLHRLADLQGRDVITVDSIRTTAATRTLLDLGTCTDAADLRRLVEAKSRVVV